MKKRAHYYSSKELERRECTGAIYIRPVDTLDVWRINLNGTITEKNYSHIGYIPFRNITRKFREISMLNKSRSKKELLERIVLLDEPNTTLTPGFIMEYDENVDHNYKAVLINTIRIE